MWLFFALLSGLLFTGEMLMTRHILRAQKDPWAYSFFFSLVGAVVCLPFMLAGPVFPSETLPWILAVLLGLLIVAHNFLIFRASAEIEASLVGAIGKLRLVWVFVLGILLLGVSFSWSKLAGTLLAIAAGVIIINKFRFRSGRALAMAVGATLFSAAVIILSKYLLDDFNAVSLTFFGIFLCAAIFNFIIMPNSVARIKKLAATDLQFVIIACSLGALANLALFQALGLHDANSVAVVSEVFLIVVLVGERMVLHEKGSLFIKLASIILAVLGAIMIQVS
jgi:drug/metabolite transporter (DMT)-like permease